MSGEGGGIIVGGVLLIAGLPYVLAGAAVVGAAVGAAALARAAVRAGMEHHRHNQLQVENCSAELQQTFGQMRQTMERQQARQQEFLEQMEQSMTQLSRRMNAAAQTMEDTDQLDNLLQQTRTAGMAALGEERQQAFARIQAETQAEMTRIMGAMDEAMHTRMSLADWEARTEAASAQQKAVAQSILRDAAATIRLLQNLASTDGDPLFVRQVEAMSHSYETARAALDQGNYQAAAAAAQTVVSRSAALALEHTQKQAETDAARMTVVSRLEGLKAELETQCKIAFEDPLYGPVEEYLDDFTQGAFERVQNQVLELLEQARQEKDPIRLAQMLRQVEDVLIPNANLVVETGHRKMLQYYQRLHALEVISGYMKSQGYTMEWAQPVGDDVTQKLVVHFREPINGNTVAIALDEDASAADVGRMAMEVMFYYENGRPVSEAEKQRVRSGISNALHQAGLGGSLSCTGSVGQSAADRTMDSADAVRQQRPNPIFLPQDGQHAAL